MSSAFAYCSHGGFLGRSCLHGSGWGGVRGKIIGTLPPDFNSRCASRCFTQQYVQDYAENHWEIQLTLIAPEVGRRCGGHQLLKAEAMCLRGGSVCSTGLRPCWVPHRLPGNSQETCWIGALPAFCRPAGQRPDKEAGFHRVQVPSLIEQQRWLLRLRKLPMQHGND